MNFPRICVESDVESVLHPMAFRGSGEPNRCIFNILKISFSVKRYKNRYARSPCRTNYGQFISMLLFVVQDGKGQAGQELRLSFLHWRK